MVKNLSLSPGVIVERVGDDLMVMVPGNTEVVKLSGASAAVLLDVQAGTPVSSADPGMSDLIGAGIVLTPGVSRRGLLKTGAIGAGAGVALLAMPGVAAAASLAELSGFAVFNQGDAPDAVVAEFGIAKKDDLFLVVIVDYDSGDVPAPASSATGTVTSDGFSGPRDAVFISDLGVWVARVSDAVDPFPPGGERFELRYQSFRITGRIDRPK
jgi:hypothetical protein